MPLWNRFQRPVRWTDVYLFAFFHFSVEERLPTRTRQLGRVMSSDATEITAPALRGVTCLDTGLGLPLGRMDVTNAFIRSIVYLGSLMIDLW